MFERYKNKETSVINSLLLVITIIQHLNVICIGIAVLMAATESPIEEQKQPYYFFVRQMVMFENFYSPIGRFGLSIARTLYIRYDH